MPRIIGFSKSESAEINEFVESIKKLHYGIVSQKAQAGAYLCRLRNIIEARNRSFRQFCLGKFAGVPGLSITSINNYISIHENYPAICGKCYEMGIPLGELAVREALDIIKRAAEERIDNKQPSLEEKAIDDYINGIKPPKKQKNNEGENDEEYDIDEKTMRNYIFLMSELLKKYPSISPIISNGDNINEEFLQDLIYSLLDIDTPDTSIDDNDNIAYSDDNNNIAYNNNNITLPVPPNNNTNQPMDIDE